MAHVRYGLKVLFALAGGLLLMSCTYGERIRMLDFDQAVDGDGGKVAVMVHHYLWHRPTGLAAFPDGGSPKITDEYVDVYLVDLHTRRILHAHTIEPSADGGFDVGSAWLAGWRDDVAYLKLTGCDAGFITSYKGCNGERVQTRVHALTVQGVARVDSGPPGMRRSQRLGGKGEWPDGAYVSAGEEGVWIVPGADQERIALLTIDGVRLEEVVR